MLQCIPIVDANFNFISPWNSRLIWSNVLALLVIFVGYNWVVLKSRDISDIFYKNIIVDICIQKRWHLYKYERVLCIFLSCKKCHIRNLVSASIKVFILSSWFVFIVKISVSPCAGILNQNIENWLIRRFRKTFLFVHLNIPTDKLEPSFFYFSSPLTLNINFYSDLQLPCI